MAEHPPQRHLILILARNFASLLATAVFLVDAEGRVIYFNEAAEALLGQRFMEGAGTTPDEYAPRFRLADEEGNPVPFTETPLGVAISRSEPAHDTVSIRGVDGVERQLEVTAFPLLAHAGALVGGIAFFWERA